MHRLEARRLPTWLPAPPPDLPAPPPWPPAPWTRAKGQQAAPPPWAAPGCRRKRGDAGCAAPMDRSFWIPSLGPRRTTPRSVRGLPVGPRRPAPRPRARRGALVLRHHNHRVHRHHNHHRHRVRRRHHHPGVISPKGPSSNSNNSNNNSSSRSSGRLASGVAGRSRDQVSATPLLIMSIGINPSFACQGFLLLYSQGRASLASGYCR
jgi:hypothetical protein